MVQRRYFVLLYSNFYIFLLVILLSVSSVTAVLAQNKKELQNRKDQLKEEIEFTNKLLNDTKEQKKVSVSQLQTLNKKINVRQELINTISGELTTMEVLINEHYKQIQQKQGELDLLKQDYAKMLRYAYKNHDGYKRLMFLFAAKDIGQAYKRFKYLQQYGKYRKKQAVLIRLKQVELNDQINELTGKKTAKKQLLTAEQIEKGQLSQEKVEKEQIVSSLQSREKQLKKELKDKQEAERRLAKAIEEAIRKEMEIARRKAEAEAKAKRLAAAKNNKKPNPTGKQTAKEEEEDVVDEVTMKLTSNFEENRGRLPWPVEKGVITSSFGIHAHPALKGIMVNNNGVDINALKGTNARAVFDGQVTRVLTLPGALAVLVQHGEYWSVYSNLADVNVKAGDKITAKQAIGKLKQGEDDDKSELHLEIWKGQTRLNPADWLIQR